MFSVFVQLSLSLSQVDIAMQHVCYFTCAACTQPMGSTWSTQILKHCSLLPAALTAKIIIDQFGAIVPEIFAFKEIKQTLQFIIGISI